MRIRLPFCANLALAVVLLSAGAAVAHRVNVFAWVEGDKVFVECKYPDGTRVKEGVIRVLDSAGTELLNGRTTARGEFSFKVPKIDDLKIVLEAGMGHRAEWLLSKQDLSP
jgi:nickel transport protein